MEQSTRYRYQKVCIVGVDGGMIEKSADVEKETADSDEFLVENREITPEELISVRKYYLGTDSVPS